MLLFCCYQTKKYFEKLNDFQVENFLTSNNTVTTNNVYYNAVLQKFLMSLGNLCKGDLDENQNNNSQSTDFYGKVSSSRKS